MEAHTETLPRTQIVLVTDLGPGNGGAIHASDVVGLRREELIAAVKNPEYRKPTNGSFRCVDGRIPEDGCTVDENNNVYAQGAGGEAVFQPMVDFMVYKHPDSLSNRVRSNTTFALEQGRTVIVHGDQRSGDEGCGANVMKQDVLRKNGENIAVVAPKVWQLAEALELNHLVSEADVVDVIETGVENANKDELWDIPPATVVEVAINAGAEYETLVDDHREKLIVVDVSEHAFDELAFIDDHSDADGKPLEAFVASLGVYKRIAFADAVARGESEYEAARRVLAFIAFNIGVPKRLTAEEAGNGEALPVVVIK